jgi:hypothetical protein
VWQPSQLPAPDAKQTIEIFATIGELWKAQGWLEGAEYVRFLAEGQCVTRPVAGLTVVSLNTLYCDLGNLKSDAHLLGTVDDLVFNFLHEAIANASARGDAVWITGHVPLIPAKSRQECVDRYSTIMSKYPGVVKAHLYGNLLFYYFFYLLCSDAPFS